MLTRALDARAMEAGQLRKALDAAKAAAQEAAEEAAALRNVDLLLQHSQASVCSEGSTPFVTCARANALLCTIRPQRSYPVHRACYRACSLPTLLALLC